MNSPVISNEYHRFKPAHERIQKRLALNQCFRHINLQVTEDRSKIHYVTFGGAHLGDVLDFFLVFDIRERKYEVVSFEKDQEEAILASRSAVKKAIGQRVDTNVIEGDINSNLYRIDGIQTSGRRIFFLDFTDSFHSNQHLHQGLVEHLLLYNFLQAGDFLIITSCLRQAITRNKSFMARYINSFAEYYRTDSSLIDTDFKERNYVDLLVAESFSKYPSVDEGPIRIPKLVCKYRYQDTVPMGKWVFSIEHSPIGLLKLEDTPFEQYPWPDYDQLESSSEQISIT